LEVEHQALIIYQHKELRLDYNIDNK